MYTHAVVLYRHTIHIQSYSIDQSQEPVAEPHSTVDALLEVVAVQELRRLRDHRRGFVLWDAMKHIQPGRYCWMDTLEVYVGSTGLGVQWDPVNWER